MFHERSLDAASRVRVPGRSLITPRFTRHKEVRRNYNSHDEFRAESAERAEKTSKEAAAGTVPATRASREQEGHEIPETSSALKRPAACFWDLVVLLAPARRPASPGRPSAAFSAFSASLLPLREIVFSAAPRRHGRYLGSSSGSRSDRFGQDSNTSTQDLRASPERVREDNDNADHHDHCQGAIEVALEVE